MVRHAVTAILGLLASLGGTAALAGRGDLDPDYGEGGRLTAATIIYDYYTHYAADIRAVQLPNNRLMTVEGSLVRRFDSEGRLDPTFGDNGETAFTVFLYSQSNPVATPDGGLLLGGQVSGDMGTFEALIRLDRDGRLLTHFGGNEDGVYRLTTKPIPERCGGLCTALMGVAVDQAGRVLLARRSWDAQGHCSRAPRVDRLTPGGTIDSEFGTGSGTEVTGVDLCAGTLAFGVRGDGSVVVAGGRGVISLDANGVREASFGSAGLLSLAPSSTWSSAVLLPDGGLLLAGSNASPGEGGGTLARFDRWGRPDLLFGSGAGELQLDLGESLFGTAGLKQAVSRIALDPDMEHLYLQGSLLRGNGEAICAGGIVRLAMDGTPDAGFGNGGIACLDFGAFPFTLIGVQRNGAALFGLLDGNIHRLLADGRASPGFLTLARSGTTHEVGEKDGSATISVIRTAGQDGAVSARFNTAPARPFVSHCNGCIRTAHIAGADIDYQSASGRLEWADGEAGPRSINVDILDDLDEEIRQLFLVNIDDPQGGTQVYGVDRLIVGINDDDDDGVDDDEGVGNGNGDGDDDDDDDGSAQESELGGGGSDSWATQLALATLLLIRRRRLCCARHAITAIIGLLASLGGTAALADRGDLDPDYGEGGRLTAATIFPATDFVSHLRVVQLPDNRLMTVEGSLVRRFDSEGRLDLTFGDNGETAFTASLGSQSNPVATPDGGLLLAGLVSDDLGTFEALIRLDRDGHLLTHFGGNGDGVYRLTTKPIPERCGGLARR